MARCGLTPHRSIPSVLAVSHQYRHPPRCRRRRRMGTHPSLGQPTRDPDIVDRLLATVQPLVDAPTPEEAADMLSVWCDRADPQPARRHLREGHPAECGPAAGHRRTLGTTRPCPHPHPASTDSPRRHRHGRGELGYRRPTPAGLALCLPVHLQQHKRPDQRILRAVIALILARWRKNFVDWATAGAALGMPPMKARAWTRYAFSGRWDVKGPLLQALRTFRYCFRSISIGTPGRSGPPFKAMVSSRFARLSSRVAGCMIRPVDGARAPPCS